MNLDDALSGIVGYVVHRMKNNLPLQVPNTMKLAGHAAREEATVYLRYQADNLEGQTRMAGSREIMKRNSQTAKSYRALADLIEATL